MRAHFMRLVVDLGQDAVPEALAAGEALDLHTLAGSLRSPARLRALLRSRHYECAAISIGERPMSALQAVALVALALARADVWTLGGRRYGRAGFAARALAAAARAVPLELALSALATLRLVRASRRSFGLPRRARATTSALYLRVEPSLRWQGAQIGGAATHTRGVVNGLIDNNIEVRVVAAERPVGTERASFTCAPARHVLALVRGLGYTGYAPAIVRAAAAGAADFVYQRYQLGSYAGLETARRLGLPLVLEFNGPEVWVERHWRSGRMLLAEPFERLEHHTLREASLVVVVSEPLRRHVLAHGVPSERVLLNPNGVDVDELDRYRRLSAGEWRRRLGVPDAPTVGFIGTFGPWHGVELLPALIELVPGARWILIGGGGMIARVEAEVQARGLGERVSFTGLVERARALELLSCSDVCVSPHIPNPDGTPFFGSPTKLFEYMGLRRAIVASDLDQIGEVIEHERSGLLCPPGDVEAAAARVRRLLGDEALRERLASAALERVATRYTWRAHAQRILEALSRGGSDAA
jgi:glycosyltransferase involved in cell wall biosynthesis